MKNICVFCGSSLGKKEVFSEKAYGLGVLLAQRNIRLVFGGSKVGLMGKVAQGVLDNHGEVTGVIPNFLARKEVAHDGIEDLIRVETMHERKKIMSERSQGFIALPGGFGTLEELCEILTWNQLQLVKAPVGILNIEGFFDFFMDQLKRMVEEGLLKEPHFQDVLISDHATVLLDKMNQYQPPEQSFWAKLDLT